MILETTKKVALNVGPAGRAIAQPMDSDLIEAIYQHTSIERSASAQYFAISLWFFERELRGFSEFFNKESIAERQHAMNFAKYLIARGQTLILEAIPKPNQDWTSVHDLISFTFQMEADVTSSIQQIYSMAERSGDTRTTVFLDPIIESQTKSEDTFAHLLSRVQFANNQPSALLIIDNELVANKN